MCTFAFGESILVAPNLEQVTILFLQLEHHCFLQDLKQVCSYSYQSRFIDSSHLLPCFAKQNSFSYKDIVWNTVVVQPVKKYVNQLQSDIIVLLHHLPRKPVNTNCLIEVAIPNSNFNVFFTEDRSLILHSTIDFIQGGILLLVSLVHHPGYGLLIISNSLLTSLIWLPNTHTFYQLLVFFHLSHPIQLTIELLHIVLSEILLQGHHIPLSLAKLRLFTLYVLRSPIFVQIVVFWLAVPVLPPLLFTSSIPFQ